MIPAPLGPVWSCTVIAGAAPRGPGAGGRRAVPRVGVDLPGVVRVRADDPSPPGPSAARPAGTARSSGRREEPGAPTRAAVRASPGPTFTRWACTLALAN